MEEKITNEKGQVEFVTRKTGTEDKIVQTEVQGEELEQALKKLGINTQKIDLIADSIRQFAKTNDPIVLGDEDIALLKKEKQKHND